MRWMAAACTMLALSVSAEDAAPQTDADRSALAPNLVIAPSPKDGAPKADGTQTEKPFTWSQLPGGIPGSADPGRKPGEPLVIGGTTPLQYPAPYASPSSHPESQDQDRPAYRWHYPVLHLPIELPSISISGVSSMMGRMQVAQDAKIETRYITVPLPGVSPYLTPYAPHAPATAAPKRSPQHEQMIERQKMESK